MADYVDRALGRPAEASLPAVNLQWWPRLALAGIILLTAVLDFFRLNAEGDGNLYYAAAVKSMTENWHAFFFASLDPGGFVSIDKPPAAFWIQAASAKLFGFSGLALLLPQALAGILSVIVLYYLVSRLFGQVAGLLAALALAITPVAVAVNRSNLVESILVLTVLLAAWAVTRAAELGRLRWLLLGAALVGIGFNIKMLEAYLVLPALILVYLLGAPLRWPARLWHLLLAAIVLLAVSLSWVTAVDLTPASQRPYVGSSGNNSELSLALGYNGLGRLTGNAFSFLNGGTTLSKTISNLTPANLGFTRGETGAPGVQRLVNAELGGQASWLLLLAVIGFVAGAWQRRVRLPLDPWQQSLLLWGAWLLTGGAFFSVAGFFHAYYLAMIAPPIAALAGIGIVTLWRDYLRPGWRGWALPLALVATAAVQAHILGYFPSWSRWMAPLVVGACLLLAAVLAALRLGLRLRFPVAPVAAALAVLALLLAPAVWTQYTVAQAAGGMTPSAGPPAQQGFGRARFFRPGGRRFFGAFPGRAGERPFPPPPGGAFGGFGPRRGDEATVNKNLESFLLTHQGHASFLVATLNAAQAEPFILDTGKPVMDLGGFMGADRILTPAQLARRVSAGTVRYFLLQGGGDRFRRFPSFGDLPSQIRRRLERRGFGPFRGGFGGAGSNNDLVQWVSRNCAVVPPSAYHTISATVGGGFGAGGRLYDCAAYAAGHPAP